MLKGLLSRAKTTVTGRGQGSANGGGQTPITLEAPPADSRARAKALLMGLQDSICSGL